MKTVNRNTGWFPSIFDDLFIENRLDTDNYESFSIPAVNIKENFSKFVVEFAAPGLMKEDFAIEIEKDVLKVSSNTSGERGESATEEDTKFTRKEFNYGNFTRTFQLPETIERDEIEANYENGILRISLPKMEKAKDIKRMVEIS